MRLYAEQFARRALAGAMTLAGLHDEAPMQSYIRAHEELHRCQELMASSCRIGENIDPADKILSKGFSEQELIEESRRLRQVCDQNVVKLRIMLESAKAVAAAQLGMAFRTAVCHRYRIFQKLRVHETASVVRLAVRAGLIQA